MNHYDFTRTVDGKVIYAEISPCSWMYSYYGLQIGLKLNPALPNAGTVFVHRKEIKWNKSIDMDAIAQQVVDEWLKENGTKLIVLADESWKKSESEFAKKLKEYQAKDDECDREMKQKGFTHVFNGWIHPKAGDDRPVCVYTKGRPTRDDIKKFLRGCTLKTDYKISTL